MSFSEKGSVVYKQFIEPLVKWYVQDFGATSSSMIAGHDRSDVPLERADVVSSAIAATEIIPEPEPPPDPELPLIDLLLLPDAGPKVTRRKWGKHKVLLDIDHPVGLIESSTPGHFHLYIDVEVDDEKYWPMVRAMAEAGVVEEGYYEVSKDRGHTDLRLPWVKKELPKEDPVTASKLPLNSDLELMKPDPEPHPAAEPF